MPYTQPYGGFDKIKAAVPYALDKGVTDYTLTRRPAEGAAVKHRGFLHNSAGIYLPKKSLAANRPPSAYEQALSWLVHKTYKTHIKSASHRTRKLALFLVVFSGIFPNGAARRLRFGSPRQPVN